MIYENECFSNSIHDPVDPLGLSNIPNAPNHQVKSFLICQGSWHPMWNRIMEMEQFFTPSHIACNCHFHPRNGNSIHFSSLIFHEKKEKLKKDKNKK